MDENTLKALKASIQHWRENRAARTSGAASVSANACALCALFNDDDCKGCVGCPVLARTGRPRCDRTPYHAAFAAWSRWWRLYLRDERFPPSIASTLAARTVFRRAATRELNFLISLLPEGESQ